MKNTRIDKLLSNMGVGSRTEVKKMIKKNLVQVNGKIISDSSIHIDPENNEICIGGEKIVYKEHIFLMLNKPPGVISATIGNQKTVMELLDGKYSKMGLFPVGRLDKDTVGLLVLTNDGQAAHNILKPKKHVPKTYYTEVEGIVIQKHIEEFKAGVTLNDGYKTMAAELKILEIDNNKSKIQLKIFEGKYHQVKRMFESIGMKVIYLKRIKMGNLALDSALKEGEYREMTLDEIADLKNSGQ